MTRESSKSSVVGLRWFHVLPVIVSFVFLTVWGWLANQNASPRAHVHKPSIEDQITAAHNAFLLPPPRIFLMWTTSPDTFKERNYQVLEAYYFHHPNAQITLYATELNSEMFSRFRNAGYDLDIVKINDAFIMDLAKDCPGNKWIDQLEKWKTGPYYYSHITDYIRFCTLYKYGGIYSDFDALLINPISQYDSFIGKDSAVAKENCRWCFPGGDMYLAPGLMATTKGHPLAKKALEIGFNDNYNPLIFNQVGPMAVTKAFLRNRDAQRGVHVYEKDAFYPFNYQESAYLLSANEHSDALLDRLRDNSISLHLYGHKTRYLPIDSSSIIAKAAQRFRVTSKSNSKTISGYFMIVPDLIGMNTAVQALRDVRIVAVYDDQSLVDDAFLEVEIRSLHGKLILAGSDPGSESSSILLNAKNPASLNQKLSKLIYISNSMHEKDTLILKLQVYSIENIYGPPVSEIPVYRLGSLVTIIVKTVGRMDKVFELARSCKNLYPEVNIIVSDDAENITKSEGHRKMFYYLPLPVDMGLSAGRNRMIERVETEYFLTLDDDFVCDSHSRIERLIHALEIPTKDGVRFDISAAKNPVDERKFSLDFCGILGIRNQTLFLESGSYGNHLQCQHVDFVPNIFVGRTSLFKHDLQWDERLKLGEHEDFFLRAKTMNVRVLTCPSVSFLHDQVEHWHGRTKYDKMRNRVYDFWKDSLRKHGLLRLVSFGMTMMDLVIPQPVDSIRANPILARTIRLSWNSSARSFNILMSRDHGRTFRFVNGGQGEGYEGGNSIDVFMLRPGQVVLFKIFAGNRFEYETSGVLFKVTTPNLEEENKLNLIQNPSFEISHINFKPSLGAVFHVVENPSTIEGNFVGRMVIMTRSYLARTVTKSSFEQIIDDPNTLHQLLSSKKSQDKIMVSFSLYSKLESCFFSKDGFKWSAYLWIYFVDGSSMKLEHEFDTSNIQWQGALITACLSKMSEIKKIRIVAHLSAKSCASLRFPRYYHSYVRRSDLRSLEAKDIDSFRAMIGHDYVLENDLESFNSDWTGKYVGKSQCVLKPKNAGQVSQILKYCSDQRLAIVTQGGNTGLVGGSVPTFDEVIMSMTRMNAIIGLDKVAGIVDVEAGCILENIDSFVKEHGFMMPIDLGAKGSCFIGGNIATNAGGVRLIRYGGLHGTVLSLEVVLPNGEILELGKQLRKDNTGYDLKHLFIGSEGTLGVITRASILTPKKPKSVHVALLAVSDFKYALSVLDMAKDELGEILSAFEFFDSTSLDLVLQHIPNIRNILQEQAPYYLLLETAGSNSDHDSEKLSNLLENLMDKSIVIDGSLAQDESQASLMWSIRESISQACSTQGGNYKYDISVPIKNFYHIVKEIKDRLQSLDLYHPDGSRIISHVAAFGHLGDGNVHLNIMAKERSLKLEVQLNDLVFSKICEMNGSISAEHGIGLQKSGLLHLAKSPPVINMMRNIKHLVDPHNIMNPYKIF